MENGFLKDVLEGRKYQTDLLMVLIFAILGFISVILLPDGNIIRMVLGLVLLIFFPGYALASALWPEAYISGPAEMASGSLEDGPSGKRLIDNLERIGLSFGLSIVLVSITGIMLHFTSVGITLESTLLCNFALILTLIAIAFYRRRKITTAEAFHLDLTFSGFMPQEKTEKLFSLAIAITLVLASITLAYSLMIPNTEQEYSTLYYLDANGTAQNYPVNLTISSTGTVIVGISCHEYSTTRYTILAGIEGANVTLDSPSWNQTFVLDNSTLVTRDITLDHLELFEERFSFNIPHPGTYKITWALLIDGQQTDYNTHLWVEVHGN